MARKPKTKREKVTPTYLADSETFTLGLHDVVRALKVIEKHRRLDAFTRAAKRRKAIVSVEARTVNFVKDFMVKHGMHDDPVGKHIVNARVTAKRATGTRRAAAARDPFRPCSFGRGTRP